MTKQSGGSFALATVKAYGFVGNCGKLVQKLKQSRFEGSRRQCGQPLAWWVWLRIGYPHGIPWSFSHSKNVMLGHPLLSHKPDWANLPICTQTNDQKMTLLAKSSLKEQLSESEQIFAEVAPENASAECGFRVSILSLTTSATFCTPLYVCLLTRCIVLLYLSTAEACFCLEP